MEKSESRAPRTLPPGVFTVLSVSILAFLFALSLKAPARPAEATAAMAAVESCYKGEAIASYQLGESEPRRLPLQTWILSAIARGQPHRVTVGAARVVSFLAIVVAAAAAAIAFGSGRWTTVMLILVTPAIWAAATRGTPGALLAALITLGWAAYESGRRWKAPTLQWTLPLILGAAASLLWSPAILFVTLALALEALRLARSREVAWTRLAVGVLGAVALIGAWRMAYTGFTAETGSWWARIVEDLGSGDPVLAARGLSERVMWAAQAWIPAIVLLTARGWPGGVRTGFGITVAACSTAVLVVVAPGVPGALVIPAVVVALGVLGRSDGSQTSARKVEPVLIVLLLVLIALVVLRTPRDRTRLDTPLFAGIGADDPVVVDREIDAREAWEIVGHLGRPASRSAQPGVAAWHVGPGLAVERPENPEGWALLARPLIRPVLQDDTREAFERNLAEAMAAHEANPGDALSAVWVGRRIAYLGRYRDAIEWYGDALLEHPNDSRFLRHRGHRYVSVRQLDHAIDDLERAAALEEGRADRVEPDGLPNAAGIPRSTTQTNIWYHLGLAYYLKGDLEQTVRCYRRYIELSDNDDTWVAGAHWLHIALRRLGRDAEAAELLRGLRDEMEILENDSYHDLLMLYAGRLDAAELQGRLDRGDVPSQAALAYGLARWYDDGGDTQRAHEAYRRIVAEAPWAAFGAIAAEAEIAARLKRETPVW
ncbi:MAG: tetratricopeptide repeat protein [Acidobacteriota bacterium]